MNRKSFFKVLGFGAVGVAAAKVLPAAAELEAAVSEQIFEVPVCEKCGGMGYVEVVKIDEHQGVDDTPFTVYYSAFDPCPNGCKLSEGARSPKLLGVECRYTIDSLTKSVWHPKPEQVWR